jgi:hypothetical protein
MQAADPELRAWLEVMPQALGLPFQVAPQGLYDICELYGGFDPARPATLNDTFDSRVYRWTRQGESGKPRALLAGETVAARLHDTAMDRHVAEFLDPQRQVTVGFMGGHDVSRAEPAFAAVARIARALRRRGFMIVTGGGPGLMEAANFGAFMAPFADHEFTGALGVLAAEPSYGGDLSGDLTDRCAWLAAATRVRTLLLGTWNGVAPAGGSSLGIPTWYYGAEPPNLFAAVVGKYFFNSLREDGLVSVANGGTVFGRGAAGTVQEVFQNANLNFYRDPGMRPTPMVFLDKTFWADPSTASSLDGAKPLFPLVQALAREAASPFDEALLLTDDETQAAGFIFASNADTLGQMRVADLRLARP